MAFFLIVIGQSIIHPQALSWLLDNQSTDSVQHLVGWEFFRYEPWHWPLGLITQYGFPISTSIVYTDSIPIFALIFKVFSQFLPANFQYFGLWYVLCFVLQGMFAWAISAYMTSNKSIQCCITLFFVMSPIMLDRLIDHQALAAHWVILAGLLLYIRPSSSHNHFFWFLLNAITLLIHAYLEAMVLGLWLAFLLKEKLTHDDLTFKKGLFLFTTMILMMFCLAWLSGYFVISGSGMLQAGGSTFNAMNLLAPFRPTSGSLTLPGHWSRFIPAMTTVYIEQGDEGFNYLGLGVLLLLPLMFYLLVKNRVSKQKVLLWLPLIWVCMLLAIYALSHIIYMGKNILLAYPLPAYLTDLTQLFRAPGRFFWPAYYGLMVAVFMVINQRLKSSLRLPLIGLALIIQAVDLSPKWMELHRYFLAGSAYKNNTAVEQIAPQYAHMVFLPAVPKPQTQIKNFGSYIHYAATHGMSVNVGYFARKNTRAYRLASKKLLIQALYGNFSEDTFYIILNPVLLARLKLQLGTQGMVVPFGQYTALFVGSKA